MKDLLTGTLVIPMALSVILVPYSLWIGWSLLSLFLFWFVLIPVATFYLPPVVSSRDHTLFKSLAGLLLFYGAMVFMIYDHDQTDYFQVMIVSFVVNIMLVIAIVLANRRIA